MQSSNLEYSKYIVSIVALVVSVLGFGGTITTLWLAFRQFRRNEQWKRAEFVAKEIKEFETDDCVINSMFMIDWGERRVNLFQEDGLKYDDWTKISREMQWRALVPHTIKKKYPSRDVDPSKENQRRFLPEETMIRDTYDDFLKYLQRFGNFVESNLVSSSELKPYLFYWIKSIATGDLKKDEDLADDNNWRCALLCYINFYGYSSVIRLFNDFGFEISPSGKIFKELKDRKIDLALYEDLLSTIRDDREKGVKGKT